MNFESTLNIGEIGWCIFSNKDVRPLTIGLIRIEKIDSPGMGDSIFDNYKPQLGCKEEYMCVETGIGSGNLYILGRNIFKTKEEAEKAVRRN
jgi:hypothetical protein